MGGRTPESWNAVKPSNKDLAKILKLAQQHGFKIVRQRKHLVLQRGEQILSLSVSPSCPFAAKHAMGDLQRLLKAPHD